VKLLTIGFLAFAAVVLSSQIACTATRGVDKDNVSLPRPLAVCEPLPPATDPDFLTHLTAFMNAFCYKTENWQHDAQVRTSDSVHPYVRLWYSPALFKWMTEGRVTNVPDGAMVVKEQYQSLDSPLMGWTVMVKDSKVSWDGWYWGDLVYPSPPNPNALIPQPSEGCAEPQVIFNGVGLPCLNCHASAIDNQGTYSSTAYLSAHSSAGLRSSRPTVDMHHVILAAEEALAIEAGLPPTFTGLSLEDVFGDFDVRQPVPCMVSQALDHVVSAGQPVGGPAEFLTSDQCSSCHDASGTLFTRTPNMIYQPPASPPSAQPPPPLNLSTYGEWRFSMMGLAGRDPVFLAQLDTESTLHAKLAGKPDGAAFVQDTCLKCHAVMGQRQYHIDKGSAPTTLFTRDQLQDPNSKYGALGRDGVSCAVCHHMSADNLGDASTFTGNFIIGAPGEVYGPYPSDSDTSGAKVGDSVIPLPMENALGITPKFAAHVSDAKMCASCHTIILPVYDADGNQVIENGQPKVDYEQTTFLEWQNSKFSNTACQTCHMRTNYDHQPLQFKIANIEDNTFPAIPETGPSTRLPDNDLILEERTRYPRHDLLGINLFTMEMFDQFRTDLGLYKFNPDLPNPFYKELFGQRTAVANAIAQAQSETARVSILSVSKVAGILKADVKVQNLTGHDFPSGVSFRRAFVNFQVLDAHGKVLWASGNTNSEGVIVDTSGKPLMSEFFSPAQQTYQPHFWSGSPITNDHQVQIYEELVADPQGLLTTSFLSLDHKVKDNRLQPQGMSPTGPNFDLTAPVGVGGDPNYTDESGTSVVRYEIPVPYRAAIVRATLYYQSIPPYYLRQRATEGQGPDTARLVNFARELDVNRYQEIRNWKLQIATSGPITIE
jgi:hypothetical protein